MAMFTQTLERTVPLTLPWDETRGLCLLVPPAFPSTPMPQPCRAKSKRALAR
jgi:hypothetical protein